VINLVTVLSFRDVYPIINLLKIFFFANLKKLFTTLSISEVRRKADLGERTFEVQANQICCVGCPKARFRLRDRRVLIYFHIFYAEAMDGEGAVLILMYFI